MNYETQRAAKAAIKLTGKIDLFTAAADSTEELFEALQNCKKNQCDFQEVLERYTDLYVDMQLLGIFFQMNTNFPLEEYMKSLLDKKYYQLREEFKPKPAPVQPARAVTHEG